MIKSYRFKLTQTYIAIVVLVLLITGLVLFFAIKNQTEKLIINNLISESKLLASIASIYDPGIHNSTYFEDISYMVSKDTGNRITIIDKDGLVLGDSNHAIIIMEEHSSRPEFFKALKGGIGIETRYSTTEEKYFLYVAVPFKNEYIQGAARIAMPVNKLDAISYQHSSILFTTLFIVGIMAILLGFYMAGRFSEPLKVITEVVKDMATGNLERRIHYQVDDELKILTDAFNDLAEYLESNINEISMVKNRLEAVLDNTVNGVLIIDNESMLTYVNPVGSQLLGIGKDSLGRKHVEAIKNFELIEAIDLAKANLKPINKKIVLYTRGEKILDVNIVPIKIQKESSFNVLVVMNNLTEIKYLEQIRKDFVSNVSHELKTPVAAISGYAETLLDEVKDNEEKTKEFAGIIFSEAQRLSSLIKRLLELSRLETELPKLNITSMDIRQLILETLEIMQKRTINSEFKFEYIGSEQEVIINADAELIAQVLINIIDNAVNYSPIGSNIKVYLEDHSDYIKVSVEDEGEGIPTKDLSRIFERFYRVDKTRCRKTGGTGLGLSIVKHLIENHGGQVGVDSKVGIGSVFYFYIPKNL